MNEEWMIAEGIMVGGLNKTFDTDNPEHPAMMVPT